MGRNDYHVDATGALWRGQLGDVPGRDPGNLVPLSADEGEASPAIYRQDPEPADPHDWSELRYDEASLRSRFSSAFYAEYFARSPVYRGWRRVLIAVRHKLHGGHCWKLEGARLCRICRKRPSSWDC